MDDCPSGHWIGRSLAGYFGFVRIADMRVDAKQLRTIMMAASAAKGPATAAATTSAEGIPLTSSEAKLGIRTNGPSAGHAADVSVTGSAAVDRAAVPAIRRKAKPSDSPPPPPPGSATGDPSLKTNNGLGVYSSIDDGADENSGRNTAPPQPVPRSTAPADVSNAYDSDDGDAS